MLDPQSFSVPRELTLHRSFDAQAANAIFNDPSVFPTIATKGVQQIDISGAVANARNVLMLTDGGAIFFLADIDPGIYEVHTSFLERYRGRYAIEASLAAYHWMFTHTDCMSIVTQVPASNRSAALAARAVGFVPRFTRKGVWETEQSTVDVRFYELNHADWMLRARAALISAGKAFHDRLDAERARHGHTDEHHPQEDCHDLYVGAAIETVYGGQPEKAVVLYNRWARQSGYGQIALVARSPLVIDIGDAVLLIEDRTFKVIKCR